MNERIKQLAERAHWLAIDIANDKESGEIDEDGIVLEPDSSYDDDFREKFAELIVQECIEVANTYQNVGGNCYVHNMIAKQFGVEK
jgi:GMP synthase-like glutamine amidotransferase